MEEESGSDSDGGYVMSFSELLSRKERAFQQRIHLIETIWPNQNENIATFGIKGTSGDVYLVKVDTGGSGICCTLPCNLRLKRANAF